MFGEIEYEGDDRGGMWLNEEFCLLSVSPHPLSIFVPGTTAGPSDQARQRFAEILARLPQLNAQVESELFEDYQRYRDEPEIRRKGLPEIVTPQDVWRLSYITVIGLVPNPGEQPADFDLSYGIPWDYNDHVYFALFAAWQLIELRKDG